MLERIKPVFLNILLLAFSLILGAGLGELLIRLFYPEFGIPIRQHRLFTEYDPLLGWRKVPNFRGVHSQKEYRIVEKFNSKGIRGPEYPYKKDDNEFRILILGDSFAEGYVVEFTDLFSEVLKRQMNKLSEKFIEVINAGTGGYSTDQELLYFSTLGKLYDPDLTILMFHKNDPKYNVRDNYWRGRKPLFVIEEGILKLSKVPGPSFNTERETHGSQSVFGAKITLTDYTTWYMYRFLIYNIYNISRVYKNLLTTNKMDIEIMNNDFLDLGNFEPLEELYPLGKGETYMWDLTEALLNELKEEVESVGGKFLIFYIPGKSEIYDEKWQIPGKTKCYVRQLEVITQTNHMSMINPISIFKNEGRKLLREDKLLYYRSDDHWNVLGNHLTGTILAQYIKENCSRYELCESIK